jgi:hypothetical protein
MLFLEFGVRSPRSARWPSCTLPSWFIDLILSSLGRCWEVAIFSTVCWFRVMVCLHMCVCVLMHVYAPLCACVYACTFLSVNVVLPQAAAANRLWRPRRQSKLNTHPCLPRNFLQNQLPERFLCSLIAVLNDFISTRRRESGVFEAAFGVPGLALLQTAREPIGLMLQ